MAYTSFSESEPLPQGGASAEDLAERIDGVAADLRSLVAAGRAAELPGAAIRELMSALVATYGARFDAGLHEPPIDPDPTMGATPVLITTSALLKAANLEIFELGMWQSWSGTR